jgi:uncharacterized protein YjbI with pentapeptide repeats
VPGSLALRRLGGSAYAVNTVRSSDIVDNEVNSADVKDGSLNTFDVHSFLGVDVVDGTLTGADIENGTVAGIDIQDDSITNDDFDAGSVISSTVRDASLTGTDIANLSLTTSDMAADTLTGADVANDSLTGLDINEASLAGVRDSCHGGAVLLGRICAGSDGGLRTQQAAFDQCASFGLKLPSLGEAVLMGRNFDVPGVADGQSFWTDSIADINGATYVSNAVFEDGHHIATFATDTARTVCVEDPSDLP